MIALAPNRWPHRALHLVLGVKAICPSERTGDFSMSWMCGFYRFVIRTGRKIGATELFSNQPVVESFCAEQR
ncbi:hypothetical protein [Pararhodobacter oceanensis]|uniref:hypothetical protein n=1 Tax=Pararhodobacter oceanensis TaxID=2172121 RepID=UPI003A8CDF01